jgi:hypothetical protein
MSMRKTMCGPNGKTSSIRVEPLLSALGMLLLVTAPCVATPIVEGNLAWKDQGVFDPYQVRYGTPVFSGSYDVNISDNQTTSGLDWSASIAYSAATVPLLPHHHTFELTGSLYDTSSPSGTFAASVGMTTAVHDYLYLDPLNDIENPHLWGSAGQFRIHFRLKYELDTVAIPPSNNGGGIYLVPAFKYEPTFQDFAHGLVSSEYLSVNTSPPPYGSGLAGHLSDADSPEFVTGLWDFVFGTPQWFSIQLLFGGNGLSYGNATLQWGGTDVYDSNGQLLDPSRYQWVSAGGPGGEGFPEVFEPYPAPEPASAMILGALSLAGVLRRTRRAAAGV